MSPHQSASENFLDKLSRIIEDKLEIEQFGVSELAREMGMSRSNLHRKVKSVTGKSVSQFFREIRLKKAMELLKQSEFTVSEVAYRVGFGSATYFSKCFHDQFGFPPGEAANKKSTGSTPPASQPSYPDQGKNKKQIPLPWIIVSSVVFLSAIILAYALKTFPGSSKSDVKSIIILPFHNDSPDDSNDYIVNSLMEEIINKLNFLEDLKVVSRTTSEVYRDSDKTIKEIGKELQVDYILEGSATIINNNTRVRLQLIEPIAGKNLWSKPYEREITLENIFQVQEEVALAVTEELKLILKPEEKDQIERKPTDNLVAYNEYIQAREILNLASIQGYQDFKPKLIKARELLEMALTLDTTFADAYAELGNIYINGLYLQEVRRSLENAYALMDTGLIYVEKALYHDRSHSFSLALKGTYYQRNGMHRKADQFHREASKNDPESHLRYLGEISWYTPYNQYYSSICGYMKFIELQPGNTPVPIWVHRSMYEALGGSGFPEPARNHSRQILSMDGDSIGFYFRMYDLEMQQGNYSEALKYGVSLYKLDTANTWYAANVGKCYLYLGDFDNGARWARPIMAQIEQQGEEAGPNCTAGYVYQKLGNKEMANLLLEKDISVLKKSLEYPTPEVQCGYVDLHLARVYSMLGDMDKTMACLESLGDRIAIDIRMLNEVKHWPSYDLVRETPEFKEILTKMESVFQKEHNRIASLLLKAGVIMP